MAIQKPSKPDVILPNNFGGTKTPYTDSQISNGYQEAVPQVVDGGNINYEKDGIFKYLKYLKTTIDALVDMPIGKILTVDSNNRFEYAGQPQDLNLLHRSGDETFSGIKTCQSGNPRFGFKNTLADISNKPSALTNSSLFFLDKNGLFTGEIRNEFSTTGYSETSIYTNSKTSGTSKTSYIKVVVSENGEVYATCPTPPRADDNSAKISNTQWVNSRITSIMNNKLQVVSSLPSSPKADTFYFIPED